MASGEEILSALSNLGFGSVGGYYYGSWRGYAVTLRRLSTKNFFADFAIRLDKVPSGLRKALAAAVKEKGMKVAGAEAITRTTASFSFAVKNQDVAMTRLTECLDAAGAALWQNGLAPAATCAISGAPNPDSLCLVPRGNLFSYQPVSAAVLRQQSVQTREKVEENQVNGSYGLGAVGAFLGMLVGLIPSLLLLVSTNYISAWLFALVPVCSMIGYKLFKGKMGKASIAIVVVISLLAALLLPYMEMVVYFTREANFPLGQAFGIAMSYMTHPDFLKSVTASLLQILLFMGLGIVIAWGYMSKQTNGSAVQTLDAQLGTLRPNPAFQAQDDSFRPV